MVAGRWTEISSPEDAVAVDAEDFCGPIDNVATSPIDTVYQYIRSTIVLGEPIALANNPVLGRLLLLGFVSAVDDYFRRVLAGVVGVCPRARARVSERQIQFGAIDYYDPSQAALALFEHTSFASYADVKKLTASVAGCEIKAGSSVEGAIGKFELLCHMRHASIHAAGVLNSRNARELGLRGLHGVEINFASLQAAASVCYSAVRAYNRWLFGEIVEQWIGSLTLTGVWADDRDRFAALYVLFRSADDDVAPKPAYNAYRALGPALSARLAAAAAPA